MPNFAETALGYAQKLANFFCDWPEEGWLGSDLEWHTMKRHAPTPPAGLSNSQIILIKRATAFGAVAGRPQAHPSSVQWCRGKLLRLRRAAKHYGIQGMAELLEDCFDIGYRTASSRPPAAAPGNGERPAPGSAQSPTGTSDLPYARRG
jgi:hypothetical protein